MRGYDKYMSKYLNFKDSRIKKVVDMLGTSTGLGEGLNIAKGLIENYFEGSSKAEEIILLINTMQEKKKQEDTKQ